MSVVVRDHASRGVAMRAWFGGTDGGLGDRPTGRGGGLGVPSLLWLRSPTDYYCGWTADTHPSFSVAPMTGRMDHRGGEPTTLKVTCATSQPGVFVGTLCMVLPDDDEQFTYKITCTAN